MECQVGIDVLITALPFSFALMLPRSPTCPSEASRSPCDLHSGVEMASRRLAVGRPDAEFVDVEPMLAGRETGEFTLDVDSALSLREGHAPLDLAPLGGQEDRNGLGDRGFLGVPLLFSWRATADCGGPRGRYRPGYRPPARSRLS